MCKLSFPPDCRDCKNLPALAEVISHINHDVKLQREKTVADVRHGEWPTPIDPITDVLDPRDAAIFVLHKLGYTQTQIGGVVGVSRQAVAKRLPKIRIKLTA